MNKFITISLLAFSVLLLAGCGNKPVSQKVTPTSAPKVVEMAAKDRPYVSLTPRDDGHLLYLKITNIPSNIKQIEYEVLYTASDNGNEIEKGVGDTIKQITATITRELLLGTESCTSGCKYKYDDGVIGGTISLNFITSDGQQSTYESPFTLKSAADIKKSGNLALTTENISIKAAPTGKEYYVLLKNYSSPTKADFKTTYSVFANGSSTAKYTTLMPSTLTKSDTALVGDYFLP